MAEVESNLEILKGKIKDALVANGVQRQVTQIDLVLPPELRGEHFATETAYATVHFQDSLPPKNLFVKKFSNNPVHTEMVKKMRVMDKEAVFFNKTLPALRSFCSKYQGTSNLLDFFPKCLYADDSCVVLENLVLDEGYVMLDKEEQQDYKTAKIVFGNLAKYHAATYAFIEATGREKFKSEFALSITESFDFSDDSPMAPMFDNGIATCIKILTDNPMPGSSETITKLGALMGHTLPDLAALLKRDEEQLLLVLNHGDCWNNNMLFKQDATGLIVDHKFVDLQITRYGSPCLDLGYFFMTSVKPQVRIDHFEDLLKLYYDQFETTAKQLGSRMPISFEDLVMDFKKFSKLGYLMTLSMTSAIGAFKEVDMEDLGSNPEEMMAKFNTMIANWIAANPDKANEISTKLVNFVQEYESLQRK